MNRREDQWERWGKRAVAGTLCAWNHSSSTTHFQDLLVDEEPKLNPEHEDVVRSIFEEVISLEDDEWVYYAPDLVYQMEFWKDKK